jgi:hypothetical protein
MKLFQIEEPGGGPPDEDAPGAAVGIAIAAGVGCVAIALGGNAEILPGADGARTLGERDAGALLLALRSRAEKQLARPVTHAVIAADDPGATERAAAAAGLTLLRLMTRSEAASLASGAAAEDAAALGAAIAAEDLCPR